ncbi:MAG: hypothetical protein M0C28_04045 [Candidatus Moduliflexus flocculans]|nr:hypothetical protein [Candidatus Moduliflexus flocculans]
MEAMLLAERRKHGRGKGDAEKALVKPGHGRSPGVPEAGRGVRGEEVRVGRSRLGLPLLRDGYSRVGAGFQRQGRPHGLLRRRRDRPGGGPGEHGGDAHAPQFPPITAYPCSAAPFS